MISIKNSKEIETMVHGGKILAQIMRELRERVEPDIATEQLNRLAESLVFKYGAKPSFKDYDGFPAALCVSINEVLVHGVPSERELKNGDILSLDLGIKYKGYHSDMAITVPVGEVTPETKRLIRVTKKALHRGIKKVRPGATLGDVGNSIQRYVEDQGFFVVRDLCGHGIGKNLHEDPQVLNYGKRRKGEKIKEGMILCLEPMVTIGDFNIKKSKDGSGYETKDGSLCAHFEHTIAVTKNGSKVLTE